MYDVIGVHGMEEIYQKLDSVGLFRNVIEFDHILYRRK